MGCSEQIPAQGGVIRHSADVGSLVIGYARVSRFGADAHRSSGMRCWDWVSPLSGSTSMGA